MFVSLIHIIDENIDDRIDKENNIKLIDIFSILKK